MKAIYEIPAIEEIKVQVEDNIMSGGTGGHVDDGECLDKYEF